MAFLTLRCILICHRYWTSSFCQELLVAAAGVIAGCLPWLVDVGFAKRSHFTNRPGQVLPAAACLWGPGKGATISADRALTESGFAIECGIEAVTGVALRATLFPASFRSVAQHSRCVLACLRGRQAQAGEQYGGAGLRSSGKSGLKPQKRPWPRRQQMSLPRNWCAGCGTVVSVRNSQAFAHVL
jgi:hypothetical protein